MALFPITLPANQPADRFYAGGQRIADFRGDPVAAPNTPEDWVASTTSVRGHAPVGLTVLPSGELLVDAIVADPVGWLGPDHVSRFGSDEMLLVKLLDAGQRLPIHAHPDGVFAREHLGSAHGMAEAWYILSPGVVHLGRRGAIDRRELLELVTGQQTERMLDLMHTVEVAPHDTVYVPPGLLHAIGEGILLVEVQEPEDLSILLEWEGFALDGAAHGHLGLGFDTALNAVESGARSREEVLELIVRSAGPGRTLAAGSEHYFRLDRVAGDTELAPGFAILIALSAGSRIVSSTGSTGLEQGSTTLVPHSAGPITLAGHGTVLVARPPAAQG